MWSKICTSINKGIPVVAVEWDPVDRRGHSTIVCGYDSQEEKFLGRLYQHEKQYAPTFLLPRNLQYAITLAPDDSWEGKPHGVTLREFGLESLNNATRLLKGSSFRDEEKWQLGIGCYDTQASFVLDGMNPSVMGTS